MNSSDSQPAQNNWGLFVSVLSVLCCLSAGIVCWYLSPPFVKNSPTEYGALMFSVLLAGVVGTFVSYILTAIEVLTLKHTTKGNGLSVAIIFLLIAAVLVGITIVNTWRQTHFAERIDSNEFLMMTFSLLSAIAVCIVSRSSNELRWKLQFWIIELPLFLSLSFVVIGKIFVFNQSSALFNEYVTGLPYYPKGQPFGWEHTAEKIRVDLRAAFWTGTMASVIGVQLIIAQVAAMGLEISLRKPKSDAPREDIKKT